MNHGWVSLDNEPGFFSADGERRSFGVSPRGSGGGGSAAYLGEGFHVGDRRSRVGSAGWNENGDGNVLQPRGPSRPVETQFTVTAIQGPEDDAPVSPADGPEPKFLMTMPNSFDEALGQPAPSSGVTRRGGRPPRGRGRGGRIGNHRDFAGRRPTRGGYHQNNGNYKRGN